MRKAVTKTVIFAMTIAMLTGCGQRENSNRESKSDTSSTKTSENVQEVNFNLVGEIADAEGKLSGAGEILKWENGEQITLSDYQGNEIDVKFTKNEESAMLDSVDDSTSVLGESILSVRKERGINKCALYTESGEQLIPFEADLFKAMNGYTTTRFIQQMKRQITKKHFLQKQKKIVFNTILRGMIMQKDTKDIFTFMI